MADIQCSQSGLFDCTEPKRICRRCNKQRPFHEFPKDKRTLDGIKNHCIECRIAENPTNIQTCRKCNITKPLPDFEQDANKPNGKMMTCKRCRWESTKKIRDKNPEKVRAAQNKFFRSKKGREILRAKRFREKYGITVANHDAMLSEQNGLCAICKDPKAECRWGVLVVDHCHSTKKVRGLLCDNCNRGIGAFKDNPDFLRIAAAYLEKIHTCPVNISDIASKTPLFDASDIL